MKILVVEDDKVIHGVLKTSLEWEGFNVLIANDGIEAQEIIRNDRPDLIITDIMMPNLSELELLKNYMGTVYKGIPIIVTSSLDKYDIQFFAESINAFGYFRKPFSIKHLIDKVKQTFTLIQENGVSNIKNRQ